MRSLRVASVLAAVVALGGLVSPNIVLPAGVPPPERVGSVAETPAPPVPTVPTDDARPDPSTVAPPASSPSPRVAPAIDRLRIRVPRLGIDLPLAPGDVTRDAGGTPDDFAFVFPGSAPLASGGNTYLYAHARTGMFLPLWNARLDDRIEIYESGGSGAELFYRVARIVPRVDPGDTTWLDPVGPERLTLQTSTGPFPGDPRFLVIAVPVETRRMASQ